MGRQRISGKSIVMRGRWREDRVGWWNRGGVKPALLSNSNYGHYLRYSDSTPSCICHHGLTIMLQHLSRMERDTLQKSISIFRWISLDRFFATQPFVVAPCAGLFQMRQQEAGVDMFFFIGIDVLMKFKILTLSGRRRSAAEQIPISHRPRLVSVRGGGASGLGWKYAIAKQLQLSKFPFL